MRKWLTLFSLCLGGSVLAEPFVWPNTWSEDAENVVTGSTLNLAEQSSAATFNPFMVAGQNVIFSISFYPVTTIIRDPETREFIPYAAESYKISEDGLTVTMKLRPELKWSDGAPITSQDYLFYYTGVTDPAVESPRYNDFFIGEEKILLEAPDPQTLVWTLPTADRTVLDTIASVPAPYHILGKIYEEGGAEALKTSWDTDTPVSELVWAGPFVLSEYIPDERYIFKANKYFGDWNVDESGQKLPYTSERIYTIAELPAQLNLFVAGDTDTFGMSSVNDLSVVKNAVNNGDIDATVLQNAATQTSNSFYFFNWNKAEDPFKEKLFRDKRFRQAMSYLTDRESIVELVDGFGEPAYGPVSPVFEKWYSPEQPIYAFDPEKALELLAEMGFTEKNEEGWLVDAEGNELGFTLASISSNDKAMELIQIVTDTMREYGINAEPVGLEFSALVEQITATGEHRDFDAVYIFFGASSEDWPFFDGIYLCTGEFHMWNRSEEGCVDEDEKRISDLVVEGRKTLDEAAAQEISYEIQTALGDLQPLIFTTYAGLHYSWANTVGGNYPTELINSLNGPRNFNLTFKNAAQ
ncbi:MAG: ABC transporter substrate-binding protein [Trueperaceae bacterium]